jgi:hypothetical protein
MNEEIRVFMNQICTEFGICDPLYEVEKFTTRESYKADDFLKEIFMAEGLDPDLNLALFRQVRKKFTNQFGATFYSPLKDDIA